MKNMRFINKYVSLSIPAVLLALSLTACFNQAGTEIKGSGENQDQVQTETESISEESASLETGEQTGEAQVLETYPETLQADEAVEDESPYFGVMYATVLSVTGSGADVTYTLVDKNNSEDSWTLTSLEIGTIETDMTLDTDVAMLFNGDVINDSENVRFLVALPDGDYTVQKVTGIVTDNMMSTFTLTISDGSELHFLKDNCRMDEDALELDTSNEITVYFADAGDLGNFPVRIFS